MPCFIIAGSHDDSVSGKTFLDVLEKAGFAKNDAFKELIKRLGLGFSVTAGSVPGRATGW